MGFRLGFYKWVRNGRYPLSILLGVLDAVQIPIESLYDEVLEIYSGKYPASGGNLSNPVFVKFPIEPSETLARVIAHLIGDGHVTQRADGSFSIEYYNTCNALLSSFASDLYLLFGTRGVLGVNKNIPLIRSPSPVGHIMLKFAETYNSKRCRVPDFIKNATPNIKREFLKAMFDDEASVQYSPPHRKIELTLANEALLSDIKQILESFDIKCTRIYRRTLRERFEEFCFYITGYHNLIKFYKYIGFCHPKKQAKLKNIIENPGRKSYGSGETKNLILNILKQKVATSLELANNLQRKRVTINWFLTKLRNENKIKVVSFGKYKTPLWGIK